MFDFELYFLFFFFKQKTAYEMRISDWSSDVCSSDLAYAKGDDLRFLGSDVWMPRLRAFQPQLVFISAGFDAHREDDMGQLGLVESDYAWKIGRASCRERVCQYV